MTGINGDIGKSATLKTQTYNYDILKYAKIGIIKSGTSTLEAGLFELPHIVVYSTNRITYLIGKLLIKVKNIAMVNIVSGEKVVHELIQDDVNQDKIFDKLKDLLNNEEEYDNIRNKLSKLKSALGNVGASKNAASIIYSFVK